ncbi:MAG: hypothetical protein V4670_01385 [Bacteroidota bacterium]
MKFIQKNLWFIIFIGLLFMVDPLYAGPGGAVAKGLFKTFWGKILISVIAIILLPVILYIYFVEYINVRKNKRILQKIGLKHKNFSWLELNKEFSNIIRRVYIAWENEDMSEVNQYVNHWYWQNQQKVFLDYWKKNNLKNISKLKVLDKINPLYIELTNDDNLNGSKIAVLIKVDAEDYLVEIGTNKIVEGVKGYQNLEYIWIFEYTNGKWLLGDIQESTLSLGFAKMQNVIPVNLQSTTA